MKNVNWLMIAVYGGAFIFWIILALIVIFFGVGIV